MTTQLGYDYPFRRAWRFRNKEEEWFDSIRKGTVLNICSGESDYGDCRIDLEKNADICADMRKLPIKSQSFGTVIFDPPFKWWYKLGESRPVIKEVLEIAKEVVILVGQRDFIKPNSKWEINFYWKMNPANLHSDIRWYTVFTRKQTSLLKF